MTGAAVRAGGSGIGSPKLGGQTEFVVGDHFHVNNRQAG
jgi:hypothetical protein